jgi:Cu/Zn superoxide dismutase
MRRKTVIGVCALAAGLLSLALSGCGGDDGEEGAGGEVTVELAEQNGSGQSGTATLAATGDGQTLVTLELSNPGADTQPVHVHSGSCAELGEVAYPLTNLDGGASETTLDVAIDELQGGGFAINAHESEENIQNYVACGDIG